MKTLERAGRSTGWIRTGLWVICLAGLAVRGWLADQMYPMTGDPLFSYTYRATLIAAGQWAGLFLMWHPPGYPLLLGGLTAATDGALHPYWSGVVVSMASYLALFWVVDRLVARRAYDPGTRLVAGSFVAFYETLFLPGVAPLTEPVYLIALYGAVLVLDRQPIGATRAFFAGLILGAAFTVRLEAAAPAAGLAVYVAVQGFRAGRWPGGALAIGAFTAGWFAAAGWLAMNVEYLGLCMASQRYSYTIAPASSPMGVLVRAIECAYHAATVWLPFALLLPYWLFVGAGLTHRAHAPGRPILHPLLLAIVLPGLATVAWTIMHKRTASFLLPAAAIWLGLGVEVLARRWAGRRAWLVGLVMGLVILANAVQAVRVGFFIRKKMPYREDPVYVATGILREARAAAGPAWAFGYEPEAYALCGWPIVYPYFDRNEGYNQAYSDHAGNPAAFIAELRRRGFRYLIFVLGPHEMPDATQIESQQVIGGGPAPLREDLEQLAADPARFALEDLGRRPANRGRTMVHVYLIR